MAVIPNIDMAVKNRRIVLHKFLSSPIYSEYLFFSEPGPFSPPDSTANPLRT
jgi:hypothetical protein